MTPLSRNCKIKKGQKIYLLYFIEFNMLYINLKIVLQMYIYSKVREWQTLDSKYFFSGG